MPLSTTRTSIIGKVEHAIDLRTGDVWIRLITEQSGLTSVLYRKAQLKLGRGTLLVCIGEWARSDSGERLLVADFVRVALHIVHLTQARVNQAASDFAVRPGSAIDLQVKKDLETLFGHAEHLD